MLPVTTWMAVSCAPAGKGSVEMEHHVKVGFQLMHFNKLIHFFVGLDINECFIDFECDINSNCSNEYGSYSCFCNAGYTGDGFSCEGKV